VSSNISDVEIHIIYNKNISYIIKFKLKIVQNIKVCVLKDFWYYASQNKSLIKKGRKMKTTTAYL